MTKPLKGAGGIGNGGNGSQRIQGRGDAARTTRTEKKQQVGKANPKAQVADVDQIDPRAFAGQTIAGVESPLSDVLWRGVAQLAEKNGWSGGQSHPLGMLMSALGPTEKPEDAFSKESRDATRRQFVSVGFDREKAGELVGLLAFVVAGLYTDPSAKKRSRETVIQHEIDKIRAGITDIKKAPQAERETKLAKVLDELLSRADQLQKRTAELGGKDAPDALRVASERIRAVFAITSIISQHVLPPKTAS